MNPLALFCSTFAVLLILFDKSGAETIVVSTNYGKLQGIVHTPTNSSQKIAVFFGIPFAQAPMGTLRFERPLPPSSWKGIREAGESAKPSGCVPHARPGKSVEYSEDCLYLNIFTPHTEEPTNVSHSTPVLFVIHGGAYEIGSAARYFDYDLLGARFVNRGLIFVSVQYRLGVLGFATTGDKELPGNLGIWDQIAALRWIKENIHSFGGDPNKVTVLGYSAGSGSTGLLSTTPAAKDLFSQTVRMSGAILSSSGSGTFVPKNTEELASALNCTASHTAIKKCFQSKSLDELFDEVQQIGPAPIAIPIAKFAPNRGDHSLFPMDHPEAIAKSVPKRTMLGFTELDFLLMTLIMGNSSVNNLALTDEQVANYGQPHFEAFLKDFAVKSEYFDEQMAQIVRAEVLDFYVNKYEPDVKKDREFFLRLHAMVCSDLMMVVPLLWESQIRIGAGWPIFLYEYKYINPETFPERVKVHVAYHDYDHSLLFDKDLIRNEDDRRMSEFLIESIANFVKNGDPSSAATKWKPTGNFSLDDKSISHMEISANPTQKLGMEGELKRLQFWMRIRQKYGATFDMVRGIYGNNEAMAPNGTILVWLFALIVALGMSFYVANLAI